MAASSLKDNPLSLLFKFFCNGDPSKVPTLFIDRLSDLDILQQVQTLKIDNISSHTKRNETIQSLSYILPDLKANTFLRIRLKSILSSYYTSYIEIERIRIQQWTHREVAFSFFVHSIQRSQIESIQCPTCVWQFVHYIILFCEEQHLTGIRLYQLLTKNSYHANDINIVHFIETMCKKYALDLNWYPLEQIQNEMTLWLQQILESTKRRLTPSNRYRIQPRAKHAHIDLDQGQSFIRIQHNVEQSPGDLNQIATVCILEGVYHGLYTGERFFKNRSYTTHDLMNDLCDMVLGGEQRNVLLYRMLYDELNITDAKKRQKIYNVLLFKYIDKHSLNKWNIIKIVLHWMWFRNGHHESFDLIDVATQCQTMTKSKLLSYTVFTKWEPSDMLNFTMFLRNQTHLKMKTPNKLDSPLNILCTVFDCNSLYTKLNINHLDIKTQCKHLKMNDINTKNKRKHVAYKLSCNIYTQIQLNHVLSKYYQSIAQLLLYDLRIWKPHHLILSLVYHLIETSEINPKIWDFISYFAAYCLMNQYDGNAFLVHINKHTKPFDWSVNAIKMIFPNMSEKLQIILCIHVMDGLEGWIIKTDEMGPRSWAHVSSALSHELYAQIASSLNVIVNANDEYSDMSVKNIQNILNQLKKRTRMDAKEMEYITDLIHRVISSRSQPNASTLNKSLHMNIDGFDTQMLYDVYNVHNCFLFANYRFAAYRKDAFKTHVLKYMKSTHLEKEIDDLIQHIPSVDLYPHYIIDDDFGLIWSYFFTASHFVHKLRSAHVNNTPFAFKIVIVPNRIISICNEKHLFPDDMGDIYQYFTIQKNMNTQNIHVLSFAKDEVDSESIAKQMNHLFEYVRGINENNVTTQKDILIVVDRRQNNMDKIYLIFKCDINVFPELNAQYNMSLHFDIIDDIVRCYLYYGSNVTHKMRFFPEYLTTIIPRFFKKDENLNNFQRMCLLFAGKYRHGFAVSLSDPTFDNHYKYITKWTHVSVSYDRNIVQPKDADIIYELPDNEVNCTADRPAKTDECVFIEYIIDCLTSFKDIETKSNNDIMCMRLTECYTHIICVHSFCLDPDQRVNIKKYVADMVGECELQSKCGCIRQHTYRTERTTQPQTVQNTILISCLNSLHCYLLHDDETMLRTENSRRRYVSANPLQFTDKVDKFITSAMQHSKQVQFVKRLVMWMQSNAYDWESLKIDMECTFIEGIGLDRTQSNMYHFLITHDKEQLFDQLRSEYIHDSEVNAINFGISVLEWFARPFQSKYKSLSDEMINNAFSDMTEHAMSLYEKECKILLNTRQTVYQYKYEEILCIKVYTDETELTTKFREAFRSMSSKEMKMEFYIWAITIYQTALYHARPLPLSHSENGPVTLHHGITEVFAVPDRSPKYNGPLSTTIVCSVAEHFSGGTGLLWYIMTNYFNPFKFVKGMSVNWISRHKHESEILLNDEYLYIGETYYFNGKDNKLKVDHLLYQLKIYKEKISDKNIFWKQIGFGLNDEMLLFLRTNPVLKQPSVYKRGHGYDKNVRVIERLVEELAIYDDYIWREYIKLSLATSDAFLRKLRGHEMRITDHKSFLKQSGTILNDQTILSIQHHPLLFQYSHYKDRTVFERLLKEFGADLSRHYFAVNPQNCKINAVLNGLIIYKTKIKLKRNPFWKGIANAINHNKTVLSAIRKHHLLFENCEYKRHLRPIIVLEVGWGNENR
eukprot:744926_1